MQRQLAALVLALAVLLVCAAVARAGIVSCSACCASSCLAANFGGPLVYASCVGICLAELGAFPMPVCVPVCALIPA